MNVGEVCSREVVTAEPDTSIEDVVKLMRHHHVGDVVVIESKAKPSKPVGILTDRDIVIEVLANGIDLNAITLEDVMTRELLVARENEDVYEVMAAMRSKGYRRVPVLGDNAELVGILSLDDILELLAEHMSHVVGIIQREQQQEAKFHH